MSEEMIISISGLRGIVGQNLTASIAAEYGSAFGTFLKKRCADDAGRLSVCIGRDSRPSGQMLQSAVCDGLCAAGINVIDLGIVTTPGVSVMVRELGCVGGVIITASHNPIQYNGIKVLLSGGIAPSVDDAERIKKLFLDKQFSLKDSHNCGRVTPNAQTDNVHIVKVLAITNKNEIMAKKFKVVLDSVNGAGGRVTKKLLSEFGCYVFAINDEPTGLFAHEPEPTVDNLKDLCETVKAEGADIGFGQDPDADRVAVVDETGTYISEEYTLALATMYILSRNSGTVATNLSTSRMIDNVAGKYKSKVIRTPVGEANVAAAMLQNNCIIGGEGNGGVIELRVAPVRDSLVGIALILQLMAETGKTVSQLANEIGSYYIRKEKFAAEKSHAQQIMDLAKKTFSKAKLDTSDGCRFDFDDGWLHLRVSNTEPVIRVIVEAKDQPIAQKYMDAVLNMRKKVLG